MCAICGRAPASTKKWEGFSEGSGTTHSKCWLDVGLRFPNGHEVLFPSRALLWPLNHLSCVVLPPVSGRPQHPSLGVPRPPCGGCTGAGQGSERGRQPSGASARPAAHSPAACSLGPRSPAETGQGSCVFCVLQECCVCPQPCHSRGRSLSGPEDSASAGPVPKGVGGGVVASAIYTGVLDPALRGGSRGGCFLIFTILRKCGCWERSAEEAA